MHSLNQVHSNYDWITSNKITYAKSFPFPVVCLNRDTRISGSSATRTMFLRSNGYLFRVTDNRKRVYNKTTAITSNTTVVVNNSLEVVKASRCSSPIPGTDITSKVGLAFVPTLRYPSMKAFAAELMKSSIWLFMDSISKGAMFRTWFQSTELLAINISAATLLTKFCSSSASSPWSVTWNAFEKTRFTALEGKLPSGGCPEDMTSTVPSAARRTRPPDMLGCRSHTRTLERGPTSRISGPAATPRLVPRRW